MPSLATSACFVPPAGPFETDKNTAPRLEISSPAASSRITLSPDVEQIFIGEVVDPDPNVITLRFFIDLDYAQVVPLTEPTVSPGIQFSRFLNSKSICERVGDTQIHTLELYISDSGFVGPTGREINAGGARDNVAWRFDCQDLPGGG